MKELAAALLLRQKYNKMEMADLVKEFEEFTGQKIPEQCIKEFSYCGLNNIDLITSDWLGNYGIKNLWEFTGIDGPSVGIITISGI